MKNIKITGLVLMLLIVSGVWASPLMANNDGDGIKATSVAAEEECAKEGPDKQKTLENISLYRGYFKQNNYQDALPYWRYVFANAPGFRKTTHVDGEKMYKAFMKEASDQASKDLMMDTIMMVLDQRVRCFGQEGYVAGKKGILLYTNYPDKRQESFDYFEQSFELSGNGVSYSIFLPYFLIAIDKFNAEEIGYDEIKGMYENLNAIKDHKVSAGDKKAAKFKDAVDKITPIYESIIDKEAKELVSDCASAKDYYGAKYRENPNDQEVLSGLYRSFLQNKCFDDPMFLEVAKKLNAQEPSAGKCRFIAKSLLEADNIAEAKNFYNQAFDLETDPLKKADIKMSLARIVRYEEGNFSGARSLAKEAISLNPNWGEPYLFIGDLYAASGKKCGSGTGWKSQVVVWAAMDQWYKAKSVDSSASDNATKRINKYYGFLPTVSDGFMKSVNEGDSYSVGCWIGVKTKARFRKN